MEQNIKYTLASEEWLKDLFDNANDLIQIVSPEGNLLYVNKAWTTGLGYDLSEIIGKSIFFFISDDNREQYRNYRNQIIAGIIPKEPIVFVLQTKTGKNLIVEGVVSAKKQDGKLLYTTGIFRDISQRVSNELELRRLNDELKEKEQSMRQLLAHAPDAIVVIDERSRIIFWNPKAEELFGWTTTEVMNQSLSNTIIPNQYKEAHEKGMNRYLTTGEVHVLNKTIEITALNKEGQEFYISLTISSTYYENKQAFIAFIRDISKEKHNQLQLEKKTLELERSNADLEQFAHTASHDLQEPIRKMHVNASLLKHRLAEKLTEEDLDIFSRIEVSYQRAKLLIEDLLTYASLEKQAFFSKSVNLNDTVKQALDVYELKIAEKKAIIHVSKLPIIQGHPGQLYQIFQNLIGNALKYCIKDAAPEIYIGLVVAFSLNKDLLVSIKGRLDDYYIIEVTDHGIGFDQEYAKKIFNVFTRLHSHDKYEGTGVGLSIVKKLIENHKGYIFVESEVHKGTSFFLLFPKG